GRTGPLPARPALAAGGWLAAPGGPVARLAPQQPVGISTSVSARFRRAGVAGVVPAPALGDGVNRYAASGSLEGPGNDDPKKHRSLRPAKARSAAPAVAPRPSKKEQILSLFSSGITEVQDIALITHSRPSYVASVLTAEKLPIDYHDLYTTTSQPMNV